MQLRTLAQIRTLQGVTMLVRADLNVRIDARGRVAEDYKIAQSLPTIRYLTERGARVVVASHLGRPNGKWDKACSLAPVARAFTRLGQEKIIFVERTTTETDEAYIARAQKVITHSAFEQVILLDNVRFLQGEDKGEKACAKLLASLASIFIFDGFAVAHRAAASVSTIATLLPTYAGLLCAEEVRSLSKLLEKPTHPFVVLVGGIKMETKIPVVKNLLPRADTVLLGGGIISTYLWALGQRVGCSAIDKDYKEEILYYAKKKKVLLPLDVVVGTPDGKDVRVLPIAEVDLPQTHGIFDVGPATVRHFGAEIARAHTFVWNGAMGRLEQRPYARATRDLVRIMATRAEGNAYGVAGGGETVELLRDMDVMSSFDFVSTGGGAMLEFLSGKKLPGLRALMR